MHASAKIVSSSSLCNTITKLIITVFLLYGSLLSLYAQERENSREEARQHYLQGEQYYSQGRYKEATSEFEKAIEAVGPARIEYMEKMQEEQKGVLVPAPAPQTAPPLIKKISTEKIPTQKEAEEKKTAIAAAAGEAVIPGEEFETEEREYYIDIGDVLDVSVWQIADLSRPEVIVRPDGKISFPLIGDIEAEGLTLTQLDNIMTDKLKIYIKEPQVSIMIRHFGEQANKVVVLGEVPVPGVYKFGGPPTITEVVASAGGYTKYAVLNSIMVIRGDVIKGRPKINRVNLARILKSGRITENIFLKPNDIVYVPRSFIGNVNTFLEILQPAINEYMQTMNARHLHNVVHSKGGV